MDNRSIYWFRVIIDIAMAILVMQGWWFIALPLGIAGAWKLPYFFELVAAGIAYDSLYALSGASGLSGHVMFLVGAVAFAIIVVAKRVVRRS